MKTLYTVSNITDTNSHDLPDLDGGDVGTQQAPFDARLRDGLGVFITNHGDQPLTASLERSSSTDPDMDRGAVDTGGVTVPAGDTKIISAVDSFDLGFFRVVFSFDSIPSSADPSVTVEFQVS